MITLMSAATVLSAGTHLFHVQLVHVDFRSRRSLSAGTASTNFCGGFAAKMDFQLVLFLLECRAFHFNQLVAPTNLLFTPQVEFSFLSHFLSPV
ncbi:hypothetical protein [Lysinibacillus sp. 38-6]|uniref:hypothetical protein n=1 Tax=Lysinibacillus sp. 38-6 TaxID=3385991 RepID=UPI003908A993